MRARARTCVCLSECVCVCVCVCVRARASACVCEYVCIYVCVCVNIPSVMIGLILIIVSRYTSHTLRKSHIQAYNLCSHASGNACTGAHTTFLT